MSQYSLSDIVSMLDVTSSKIYIIHILKFYQFKVEVSVCDTASTVKEEDA